MDDENDMSILQSMMNSDTADRRTSLYPPIVPTQYKMLPQQTSEQVITSLPSNSAPMQDQLDRVLLDQGIRQMEMENPRRGGATEPLPTALMNAMRDTLRPDLDRMHRPNADTLTLRRFMKSP